MSIRSRQCIGQPHRLKGLNTLLHSSSSLFSPPLAEAVSPLLQKVLSSSSYTHFISAHSSSARSILPRVAATLDLPAVSDVTSFSHDASTSSTTFIRAIYAGNALTHVRASESIPLKIFTVRSTAFKVAELEGGSAEVQAIEPVVDTSECPTKHVRTELTKSDRPELGSASRVVSGGRALKDADTFKATLDPLADILGAAVGASRAAVDAGYADNSLQVSAHSQSSTTHFTNEIQVGQTGKVVAPELYMAIGISGAIQHLAGMKDSKMIVAINKVWLPRCSPLVSQCSHSVVPRMLTHRFFRWRMLGL